MLHVCNPLLVPGLSSHFSSDIWRHVHVHVHTCACMSYIHVLSAAQPNYLQTKQSAGQDQTITLHTQRGSSSGPGQSPTQGYTHTHTHTHTHTAQLWDGRGVNNNERGKTLGTLR